MKTFISAAAATAVLAGVLAAAGAARADEPTVTAEIGYTRSEFSDSSPKVGFNLIHVRGGVQFSPHFGVEMEAATGLGSDTVKVLGVDVDVKTKWEVGAFLVGSMPTGQNSAVFARVGVARARLEASASGVTAGGDDDGWAAGVGFRYFPGGRANGLRVEYTRYGFDNDEANTFSASFVHRF